MPTATGCCTASTAARSRSAASTATARPPPTRRCAPRDRRPRAPRCGRGGPAARAAVADRERGTDLSMGITPSGRHRFAWRGGRLYQRSMLDAGREWEVVQVKDSITPGDPHYNERSRLAKTLQRDGATWGLL